ncbi:MAG: sigma-54 dependent transcriptional regulator [Moraxella sp.]|nr:sigma-54 dependent transcriptional regulator [Moraxella sp.]
MQSKYTALIVDDEVDLCRLMQITLTKMDIHSDVAYDISTAKELLAHRVYDFCLTDLALPDGSGMELVELITTTTDTPVAVITAHGNDMVAIEAMKLGAFDFVNKPLELPRLRALVESALKATADIRTNITTPQDTPTPDVSATPKAPSATICQKHHGDNLLDERLIGDSLPMQQLRATIKKLARSQAPVFLWGGSGTGKEVVSRLIHDLSGRRDGSFVPVNCGAIPSELMESEFFGHKKGSFTGATSDKIGLFQQADGGTLFLDEVADLPLAMQVKLLRAIQEKTVRAIGDTKEVPVDIRIICATHKDLADLVQKGAFRQDLFYRINVIEVKLPALNDRRDDIPKLARHFLGLIVKDWGLDDLSLSDDAIRALCVHNFKGNVRELRNILERAVTLSDSSQINAHHLMLEDDDVETLTFDEPLELLSDTAIDFSFGQKSPYHDNRPVYTPQPIVKDTKPTFKTGLQLTATANYGTIKAESTPTNNPKPTLPQEGLEAYLSEQEKQLISAALVKSHGNKTQAAKLLGMTFRQLRYRMDKLGLGSDDHDDEN